jgi:hypothetical protein|tara:strand:+ start:169 stop:384 length:216 start_codon:yes stop_codon:yes gene_type:complete
MSIYSQLVELKNQLGKTALRSPKTKEEIEVRKKYGRVMTILTKRYEYNIDDALNEYRRQDQIDEITTVRKF